MVAGEQGPGPSEWRCGTEPAGRDGWRQSAEKRCRRRRGGLGGAILTVLVGAVRHQREVGCPSGRVAPAGDGVWVPRGPGGAGGWRGPSAQARRSCGAGGVEAEKAAVRCRRERTAERASGAVGGSGWCRGRASMRCHRASAAMGTGGVVRGLRPCAMRPNWRWREPTKARGLELVLDWAK